MTRDFVETNSHGLLVGEGWLLHGASQHAGSAAEKSSRILIAPQWTPGDTQRITKAESPQSQMSYTKGPSD